ncbi:protein ENHANCED DOWNY MILDEW 2-like isoform X2 [Cornus florida]|uniref:protein ENHANCED DOWNY MILDEW 2-like isoform X2 n=1 Tax=Cornus florida TaxID=4283 RepID=UPI00289A44D7|nr:protein ENHANCED DOWNY MILDEW 2-like isoform X2 [Cornus florida]
MASSDDEGELVPHTVSNYHFVDDKDEPISFAELPVQWNKGKSPDGKRKQIFLHGITDNGLQKIYKQVTAWKFDLSDAKPEISVLYKEHNWIKLQKPRKSFQDTIRTILITIHCLHFVKKNPETSGSSFWNHLSKVFSFYDTRPSETDLVDHSTLISEAVKKDQSLAKFKFLVPFFEEKPRKRTAVDEDVGTTAKSGFVVDDDEMMDEAEENESDEESDLFDSVCAICDNGGDLLCCEGRCMRSFHATVEAGSESKCESLGFSDEQVEAIQDFFCKNCQYKQHQCFSCGELASSDKLSGAEVFPCVSATCGRFYHPHCVAKLLHCDSETDEEGLQKKIAAGESFTCPIHKCHVCKLGENKMDPELQFCVCRRCPKSYHRRCLPRKIAFEDLEDEGIIQRAWEGLIPNRILIYCLKHEIDDEFMTPIRNHIKFPKVAEKKKNRASAPLSSRKKLASKGGSLASEDAPRNKAVEKATEGFEELSSAIKEGNSSKKRERRSSGPESLKKQKVMDTSRKPSNKTASVKVSKATTDESGMEDKPDSEFERTPTAKLVAKETFSSLPLDADTKRRIMALMKDASSSITLEQIIKKHKMPITHACSSNYLVDKAITLGKVEGSVEALRAALQKLEEGCSIEDAKAVCEPGLLNQIIKWKIVDMLHWYVQDGDMIVDFSCGANDFSCLVKKKLDETGKNCSYQNYDILQAKNDFNFEKRDWMSIHPKELPMGSHLIMGLNPPFGVNATLANKFIDKALEFKPKLLILTVPRETERLDKKKPPYDLVWEDDELLAGKAFYLPGSVDVNDKNVNPPPLYLWSHPNWTAKHKAIAKQHGHTSRIREESPLEENHEALYNDYPLEHHGPNDEMHMLIDYHLVQNEGTEQVQQRGASVTESRKEGFTINNGEREGNANHGALFNDYPLEHHGPNGETPMLIDYHPVQNEETEQLQQRGANVTESCKEGFTCNNGEREGNENHDQGKNQSSENAEKRQHDKGSGETTLEDRQNGRSSPVSRMNNGMSHRSPTKVTGDKSLDANQSNFLETSLHAEVGKEGYRHPPNHSSAEPGTESQMGYGGTQADDLARRSSLNSQETHSGVIQRWSSSASPGCDHEFRNSEVHIPGHRREHTHSHGYRSYMSKMDEKLGWESEIRSQVQLSGQQDPDSWSQRSTYYSRMNASTMQRHAPQVEELNHTRTNSPRFEPPSVSRNGIDDPLARGSRFQADSFGFAPGPCRFLSPHNTNGWLDE